MLCDSGSNVYGNDIAGRTASALVRGGSIDVVRVHGRCADQPMVRSRTAVVRTGDVGSPRGYTRVARLDPDLHWVTRC